MQQEPLKHRRRPPPPDPVFILRGHTDTIASLCFFTPPCVFNPLEYNSNNNNNEQKLSTQNISSLNAHNHYLISGDLKGEIRIWDLVTQRCFCYWKAHENSIIKISFINSLTFCSQGRDGYLKIWQLPEESAQNDIKKLLSPQNPPLYRFSLPTLPHGFCKFGMYSMSTKNDQDSCVVVACPSPNDQEEILVYDLFSTKLLQRLNAKQLTEQSKGMPMDLEFIYVSDSSASSLKNIDDLLHSLVLSVGYESGHVCLFDNLDDSNNIQTQCILVHSDPVLSLTSYTTNNNNNNNKLHILVSGSADNSIAVMELQQRQNVSSHKSPLLSFIKNEPDKLQAKGGVSDLSVRVDGRILIAGGWDRRVHVFDLRKRRPLAILKYHSDSIMCTAYSPLDLWEPNVHTHWGYLIASGAKDKRIAIWSIYPPKQNNTTTKQKHKTMLINPTNKMK